ALTERFDCACSMTGISSQIPDDPLLLEIWCRDIFRAYGYEADLTPRTGDQGADILAKEGGFSIVVQCKRQQNPAGNSAVQQVSAAKTFYNATSAFVVSASGFTKSAAQLAHISSVILVQAHELPDLLQRVRAEDKR